MKPRSITLAAVCLFLLAMPADADNPWTRFESGGTFVSLVLINGELVAGTYTFENVIWRRTSARRTFVKAHGSNSFVSDDGSIRGRAVWSWRQDWHTDGVRTYTYSGHINYIGASGGLIERVPLRYHYTFNANGDLVNFHSS